MNKSKRYTEPVRFEIPVRTRRAVYSKISSDHFSRYVESPELFREQAAKDPGLAEKYEFLKTKIFVGKEY